MGMAASQARLLAITARIHDVEYQAQSIQNAKTQLATQSDQAYNEYLEAMNATTLTIKDTFGNTVVANFNTICSKNAVDSGNVYALKNSQGKLIVEDNIKDKYDEYKADGGKDDPYDFAMFMMGQQSIGAVKDGSFEERLNSAEKYVIENNIANNSELAQIQQAMEKILLSVDSDEEQDNTDNNNSNNSNNNSNNSNNTGNNTNSINIGDLVNTGNLHLNVNKNFDTSLVQVNDNLTDKLTLDKATYKNTAFRATTASNENSSSNDITSNYDKLSDKKKEEYDALQKQFNNKLYKLYAEDIFTRASGEEVEDFNQEDFDYYVNIYKQIQLCGGECVSIDDYNGMNGNAASDSDWLKAMIECGKITIDIVKFDKKTGDASFNTTSVPSDTYIGETNSTEIDKTAFAKAEAEYEHKLKQIDQKDKKYDLDLSKLDTERQALTTQHESLKKVIQDNIERTFGIFS